jgi:hypothetical protein
VSPVSLVSPLRLRRDMDLILRILVTVASLKLDPESPVKIGLRMLRWQLTSMWDTRPTVLEMDRTWLNTDREVDFQVEETLRWTWFRWHKDLDILLAVELVKWIWIKSRQDMASRLVELSPDNARSLFISHEHSRQDASHLAKIKVRTSGGDQPPCFPCT